MASTSLTSALEYKYTIPLNPQNISGKVMGPNGDYSVLRSEDIAFLYEAMQEFVNTYWAMAEQATGSTVYSGVDRQYPRNASIRNIGNTLPTGRVHIVNNNPTDYDILHGAYTGISFNTTSEFNSPSSALAGISVGSPTQHLMNFSPHYEYPSISGQYYLGLNNISIADIQAIYSAVLTYQSMIFVNDYPYTHGTYEDITETECIDFPTGGHSGSEPNIIFYYEASIPEHKTTYSTNKLVYRRRRYASTAQAVVVREHYDSGSGETIKNVYKSEAGSKEKINNYDMKTWTSDFYIMNNDAPPTPFQIDSMECYGLISTEYSLEETIDGQYSETIVPKKYKWINIPISSYSVTEISGDRMFRVTLNLDMETLKSGISPNSISGGFPSYPTVSEDEDGYYVNTKYEELDMEIDRLYLVIDPKYHARIIQ